MNLIAEVGYYELKLRKANKGEKGQYFNGAGGLFETRTNLFKSVKSFLDYVQRKKFDDTIVFHVDLWQEVADYFYMEKEDNNYDEE